MKKRILSLIMTMALLFLVSIVVFANETETISMDNTIIEDGVTFSKNKKILIKYSADKTNATYSIPEGVEHIYNGAFAGENNDWGSVDGIVALETIIIPNSVKSIGEKAFMNCKNLKNINIPDSVTSIGSEVFRNCTSLKKITIPDSVVGTLGYYEFSGCTSLSDVTIGSGISSLGWCVFEDCTSLTDVKLSNGLKELGQIPFRNCTSLKTLVIPDSVTYIGEGAFIGCESLENITIPAGVRSFGDKVFVDCKSLKTIEIPVGIEYLRNSFFSGCTSLKSVVIPGSVKSISTNAFENCISLTDVYYGATGVEWNSIELGIGNEFLKNATIHFNENNNEIKVTLHGKKINFADQLPIVEDGRTLVPLRAIFEALGATVAWNGDTETIVAVKSDLTVKLTIGSNEMYVWDDVKFLDVPAKIINGRTMVPARAIAEAFGYDVSWDADNNTVVIE